MNRISQLQQQIRLCDIEQAEIIQEITEIIIMYCDLTQAQLRDYEEDMQIYLNLIQRQAAVRAAYNICKQELEDIIRDQSA